VAPIPQKQTRGECEQQALRDYIDAIDKANKATTRTCLNLGFLVIRCRDDDTFEGLKKDAEAQYRRDLATCAELPAR
jgi:hypothetical protein